MVEQKSVPATKVGLAIIDDLIDILKANSDYCVSMAANMIRIKKKIIVYCLGSIGIPMINSVKILKSKLYETKEECFSLTGVRKTTRYESIEV